MLAKDMLARTCDELLPQNKKSQIEKTIMVTTWHPALKYLSFKKVLQEKYHLHIEKDIYLKKVFPEKPTIPFRKIKPIRNYIVRTDIREADDQKRLKIMTLYYLCRKTCRLISSDETLKNIPNRKKLKS